MITFDGAIVIICLDGDKMTSFTENPENADWQAYQEWVAEGKTPEPWPPRE
jgi:hypothetical protein